MSPGELLDWIIAIPVAVALYAFAGWAKQFW